MIYHNIISRRFLIFLTGIAIALLIILSSIPSLALTDEDINNMSSQTTVLIAESLKKGDVEEIKEWYPGSGAIISHYGDNYYALTNAHVVREPRPGTIWGVRTADGEVHQLTETADSIIRFGAFTDDDQPIPGFDLAIVKFTSDRNYPVAVIGDSSKLHVNDPVYISGWPNPDDGNKRRERKFTPGQVAKIANDPDTKNGGYNVMYSNWTKAGMSGGPVFNSLGEVVATHGRGRGNSVNYCVDPQLNANNSCGIQAIHFISQIQAKKIKLALTPPPVKSEVIEQGKKNKAKADVIEDIYKLFSDIRVPLKDCPLGVSIPDCQSSDN
ncbi:MAG TPA: serine protease [Allocoleopsis sp.]